MTRVLFVCVKNGGKSQMAASLFRQAVADDLDPDRWQVESAGTQVGTKLNGLSVASLAEIGVDISDQRPRQLTPEAQQAADVVVTVGEADVDPWPGPAYETWQIDEPSLRGIDGPERMRLVRDDIHRHVRDLHQRLAHGSLEGSSPRSPGEVRP